MLKSIRNYIENNNMEVKIINNKIDISNYKLIGHFDNNKIVINGDYKITIKGNDLVISKLFDNEVLITGKIECVILGDK